jgi:FAD/FMN-containing dehydrogenase
VEQRAIGPVGVNVRTKVWGPDDGSSLWVQAPHLPDGGRIVLEDDARRAAGRDRGNLVEEIPAAILRPGGSADVASIVALAAQHEIPVAARGTGHMTGGQTLAGGGIVVDMLSLNDVHAVQPPAGGEPGWIEVDAGALLQDVAREAYKHGLRLASGLPGRTTMSVGGVLSAGGWTPNYKSPFVVGGVRWMRVVDPDGKVRECSPTQDAPLFHRVLAGVGQHGIITCVRLDLVPALPRVRVWMMSYHSIFAATRDLLQLAKVGGVDELHIAWKAPDPRAFYLEAAIYHDGSGLDELDLLRSIVARPIESGDRDYLEHVFTRADPLYDLAEEHGWNEFPKLWLDLQAAEDQADQFLPEAIEAVPVEVYSPTSVGLVIYKSPAALDGSATPPLPDLPSGNGVVLLDILLDCPDGNVAPAAAATGHVRAIGKKYDARTYSIGSYGVDEEVQAEGEGGLAPGARRDPIVVDEAAQ